LPKQFGNPENFQKTRPNLCNLNLDTILRANEYDSFPALRYASTPARAIAVRVHKEVPGSDAGVAGIFQFTERAAGIERRSRSLIPGFFTETEGGSAATLDQQAEAPRGHRSPENRPVSAVLLSDCSACDGPPIIRPSLTHARRIDYAMLPTWKLNPMVGFRVVCEPTAR
jgi:hypothetical protein